MTFLALHDDQGPDIVVPVVHKGNNRRRRKGGGHYRQEDPGEDTELPHTVHPGGLNNFVGKGNGTLPEKEDKKGCGDRGQHEAGGGIQQIGLTEHPEEGHHDRSEGDHHGEEQPRHETILPLIPVDLETVARHGTDKQTGQGSYHGIPHGVPEGPAYVHRRYKGFDILKQVGSKKYLPLDNLHTHISGGGDHPHKRKGREKRDNYQEDINQYPGNGNSFRFHALSPTFICTNDSNATIISIA